MANEPAYKLVISDGDWGSPMSNEASYESLAEAQAAAREYLVRQRDSGGVQVPFRVLVEETTADGSTVRHPVD